MASVPAHCRNPSPGLTADVMRIWQAADAEQGAELGLGLAIQESTRQQAEAVYGGPAEVERRRYAPVEASAIGWASDHAITGGLTQMQRVQGASEWGFVVLPNRARTWGGSGGARETAA